MTIVMSRRRLLGGLAVVGGGLAVGGVRPAFAGAVQAALPVATPLGTLFPLGVASGEPRPWSVVLWTRLAPDPFAPHGGMDPLRTEIVEWEVATDERFSAVAARGAVPATAGGGFAAHAEVVGLHPGARYWYRFRAGGEISPVGRTRTAPEPGTLPTALTLAVVSCNDYQHGQWGAFNGLADEDVDLWLHVGDYIYEYGPDPDGPRQHDGAPVDSIETLEQYRNRHALYKLDPALRAAHASAAVVWVGDDHEVENNYAGAVDEEEDRPTERFLRQRAAAYQAVGEHLPLALGERPGGPDVAFYRSFDFGRLLALNALDTRQYRTDQACDDGLKPLPCGTDPAATITGADQAGWLDWRLASSAARWNLIAQQVMVTRAAFVLPAGAPGNPTGDPLRVFNMDAWDGYRVSQQRLMDAFTRLGAANPVVVTGDIHSSWVADLCTDYDRPDETAVGTELVATGITSVFPAQFVPAIQASLPANPHIRYFNGGRAVRTSSADEHHGYLRLTVTPDELRCDIRQVANIDDPRAPMSTVASWVVDDGTPGARPA